MLLVRTDKYADQQARTNSNRGVMILSSNVYRAVHGDQVPTTTKDASVLPARPLCIPKVAGRVKQEVGAGCTRVQQLLVP